MSALAWFCVSYAVFALATFGWIGVITYRYNYDTGTWVARILVTVLWPVYWGAALGLWLYELTCRWKARRTCTHERHD